MRWFRAGAVLGIVALASAVSGVEQEELGRKAKSPEAESWDLVKLAVARSHIERYGSFWQSLHWWADEREGRKSDDQSERVTIQGDATKELFVGARGVVHIRGSLLAPLRVGEHSEIVIDGSVGREGRIQADGIVSIYVQGDVEGVIRSQGMAGVWIGGDLRGEILTGMPSMALHVKRNLEGSVRPIEQAGILLVDVGGNATSSLIKQIDSHLYVELSVLLASSDLGPGIHGRWSGRLGFVAVTGSRPSGLQTR